MSTATRTPAIGPEAAGVEMDPEEFDAVEEYDDGYRYELIRRILVVTPIPSEHETSPNENLGGLLYAYRKRHPRGGSLEYTLPEQYIFTPESRRRADRLIWAGLGRRPDIRRDLPTIAVEFVSAGKRNWTRDYVTKRAEYLALGIVEYWIFDCFARTLTVYQADEPGVVVAVNETYRTPLLPDFELPLSEIFEAADA